MTLLDTPTPTSWVGPDLPARGSLSAVAEHPRRLGEPQPVKHSGATARYQSPLRYPGAKSGLAPLIGTLIRAAAAHPRIGNIDLLVEPFAGGASTSLRLVGDGTVDRILLADGDPLVAAFWQVAAQQPQQLISRMRDEHAQYVQHGGATALDRWDFWRQWQPSPGHRPETARLESAVKCLFLNRTTFSGILHGRAGPIGGRRQKSLYPIGCRYNPDALADRISYVGHLYDTHRLVDVWCADWHTALQEVASAYKALVPDRVVAYLDPPYIEKSTKLYSVSFDQTGSGGENFPHERLAEYLVQRMRYRWVLSYDAHPALLDSPMLYARNRMDPSPEGKGDGVRQWRISKRIVELSYSASASRSRWNSPELLLTTLPPAVIPVDKDFATPQTPLETSAGPSTEGPSRRPRGLSDLQISDGNSQVNHAYPRAWHTTSATLL